ncbi:transcription-repair coupling factor [Limibacter armeniacum]|uniref:transcription-repair coupling factor n=1 Tax=Limibacter armeniacum TaxID=466084 RepID=UPI002FE610A5
MANSKLTSADTEVHKITAKGFLEQYQQDAQVRMLADQLSGKEAMCLQVKGMSGSLDAVVTAAICDSKKGTHLFVMHDKEEATYFLNDLQSILPEREALFFPTSYKKPYEFVEVENANILQRAEVLNIISQKRKEGELIVTYPEALTEKVINQRSLLENTYTARVGEKFNIDFITELLVEYEFEKTDFVYEVGQFAIRGGIVDIFSYAHDYPYRIELFGDEIDTIRTFDPLTQLSKESCDYAAIVPDVQTKLLQEIRESFLRFLPQDTTIWVKEYQLTLDVIENYFERATDSFQEILAANGNTQVIHGPDELFETKDNFEKFAEQYHRVEFGNRFFLKPDLEIVFESSPQPSFNKDFNMLADTLEANQHQGVRNILVAESPKQLERLHTIFEEVNPDLTLFELNLGLRGGFLDKLNQIACYTDHQIFERYHKAKTRSRFKSSSAMTLKELQSLNIGDYITHIDHGIGRFGGLEKMEVNGKEQEAVRLIYRDDDLLYISLHALHKISKYSGQDGTMPQMSKLGSQEWEKKKSKAKKKVKDIARELIKLYAKRRAAKGFGFSPDSYLQAELESSFLYEDTPDQATATAAVKQDMEQDYPMDRLVCGDVGFGKTEIAIRAAFKAVADSKQVAILVPTTILAMQHYNTFKGRLGNLPCRVEYINRFRSTKQIRETLKDLKEGKVDILIGTHRITNKDVQFKDLGLLVIDEEQKFGVKTKEKIKEMRVNVDVLTLTATPIPRTLHFSMMGARDLSVISTPPPNRQPVTTILSTYSDTMVRDAVATEIRRGGQVFFVHNRISDIEHMANNIMHLVPDAKVAYAHGQMEGPKLEKIMLKFIEGEYDVLVSTNIIESGLDIPSANTIIINRAHMFGLSDLHQMRGRVGRSNKKAYCYLMTPPMINLTAEARKRLSTLEQFSDLGDGFKVAMRDLDIRGAGNLLGGEQSGFITDLGFDAYNKILEDAVQELKQEEFKELFKNELDLGMLKVSCSIETDFEILIPEDYVSNISERLNLYIAADKLKDENGLEKFRNSLTDRFGPIPSQVEDLLKTVRLRWLAESLGMEKIMLKNDTLKIYLLENKHVSYYQSEEFGKILAFVQQQGKRCTLKETKKRLIIILDDVSSIKEAIKCLEHIKNA